MPAAAVIPAPVAYINAAAVKKLVVGSRVRAEGPSQGVHSLTWPPSRFTPGSLN